MGGRGGVKRLSIGIWNYVNHFKRFHFYTYTKSEGLDAGGGGLMHFHVCAPSHACQSTFAKLVFKWDLETPNPPPQEIRKYDVLDRSKCNSLPDLWLSGARGVESLT